MKENKLKKYALEIVLLMILFFALFVSKGFTRIMLAITLGIYAIFLSSIMKKEKILSIYHKQVAILMALLGTLYLVVFYLMGIYFGFYQATVKFSSWSLFHYIIPIIVIIIATEIIRNIFLTKESKVSNVLVIISMILVDLILYTNIYDITTFDGFFSIIGFTLFASIACNCLYTYISNRFGIIPIIIYRAMTILYAYMIPIIPNVYVFFRCFLRMLYPYLIYLVLEYSYARKTFVKAYKDKTKSVISITVVLLIIISFLMLISCQFKYGILVIGSGSMTGAMNKGDAVVFEAYDSQRISEGDIIIFSQKDMSIVHRVINIKLVNGEYRYYTKGDANDQADEDYVTTNQIIGISKFRVQYIGYPTLWLKDILS